MGLPTRKPDGEFTSMEQWIHKATSWIGGTNPLCADAKDRVCRNGGDFKRAKEENAYPIRFWFGEGGQTKAEQRKAKRNALATMKLNYPWRYT